MANISDQLAASIQSCFNQTYTDLANQQNIFFGTGDVTITKPDGGKKTVPSWEKVNQSISKLENGGLQGRALYTASIELSGATPYIDFHYNNSTADYTHRIIAESADSLTVSSSLNISKNMWVGGWLTTNQTLRSNTQIVSQSAADPSGGNGAILQTPWYVGQFNGRGADNNGLAGVGIWFEENVGYNHRAVLRVQGYNAPVRYWQFLSDGNVYGPNGMLTYNGTSDLRYKKQIRPTDGTKSLENIMKMGLVTFVYKDDEQNRMRRGVIAQQVQEIDPQYVKEVVLSVGDGPETPAENVKTTSRLTLDSNVLLMDAISAIQVLARRVEELEKTGS